MIRIHFPGVRPGEVVIPLAQACGIAPPVPVRGVDVHRFDRLMLSAPALWKASSLEDAQIIVYPHPYWWDREAEPLFEEARRRRLPLIFFKDADDSTPVHLPYGVIYRNSIFADQM